jgi:hypothetical protein
MVMYPTKTGFHIQPPMSNEGKLHSTVRHTSDGQEA